MWKLFRTLAVAAAILALAGHEALARPRGITAVTPPSAAVTCDITTGNCTGTGGGTGLFTAATCDGVADDAAAITSFGNWAVNTWQASNSGQIQLNWPTGARTCTIKSTTRTCGWNGNLKCPFLGIRNLLVHLQGGTLQITSGNLISLSGAGMPQTAYNDVPTATVNAGATCATLLRTTPVQSISAVSNNGGKVRLTVGSTAGYSTGDIVFINNTANISARFFSGQQEIVVVDPTTIDLPNVNHQNGYTSGAKIGDVTSVFTVGGPVLLTGVDLQGIWKTSQGFPPNPAFWDRLRVASISSTLQCDGVTPGASVTFTSPVTNTYLSNWPRYAYGLANFQVDPGGPATLYAVDLSWDATVEFAYGSIDYPNVGGSMVYAKSSTIIFRNINFNNTACGTPTETLLFQAINTNFGSCTIEIDKLIDVFDTRTSTMNIVLVQSPGIKLWTDTGSTISQLQGSPANFVGNGTIFTSQMKAGAVGYGRTDSFTCTNCNVASFPQGGYLDDGLGRGVQNTYSMSGGVIAVPNGARFTSVQNNGGAAQLVVDSTAGFTTGKYVQLLGSAYAGVWQITVDDATHLTLVGSTFTTSVGASAICSAGGINAGNCSPPWGAPGTNLVFIGANGARAIGQVTSLTQDANFTYVATTGLGSTFPADVTGIQPHPAPKFNCPGCTGADPQIASLAQAPTDAPLYSFQTYTIPGSVGNTAQSVFLLWGALSELQMNVTSQSTTASQFRLSRFDNWSVYVNGTASLYGVGVAAGTAGDRKVSSSGAITCNGSPGSCVGGDSLTTPTGLWFGKASNSGPQYATPGPSAGASTTLTIRTNQGVVNP